MADIPAVSLKPKPRPSVPFVELRQFLPSQIEIISPFVDQLMRFITRFRNADGSELDIDLALHEALANAIVHGNRRDARKLVFVVCRCTIDGEVSIRVQDQGQGFDVDTVADPTTTNNRLLAHGRGIYLMKTLMDEIWFEQGGAVVCMRKASSAKAEAGKKVA